MLIRPATVCGSDTPSQGQAEARRVESSSTAYVDPLEKKKTITEFGGAAFAAKLDLMKNEATEELNK